MYKIDNPDIIYNKIRDLLRDKMGFSHDKFPYSSPIYNAEKIIYNHGFYISPYEIVYYEGDINWEDINRGRTYLRYLNSHSFIWYIIDAYKITKDKKYLESGLDIIYDWIYKYSGRYDNKIAYHDETTALRMNSWLGFILTSTSIISKEKLILLNENIRFTANILANDEFHSTNTNHGMFQDISLLLYSKVFTKDKYSDKYKLLSYSRIKKYLDYIYTSEGVHKEHTPKYHYIITDTIKQIYSIFKNDDSEFVSYMKDIYEKSLNFSYQIIKPDGNLPQIGDNQCIRVSEDKIFSKLYNDKYFSYAITKGKSGVKPKYENVVFKESGYAIFRDSWKNKDNALYILFLAAHHSKYHKHSDDLSIIIYYKGQDIITEAGFRGYDYDDVYTQYAYSAYAHNNLIIDNKSDLYRFSYNDKIKKIYIKEYNLDSNCPYVVGVNERYKNIVHKRTVKYNKENNSIFIIDKISSNEKHNYKIGFNLGDGIEFFMQGDKMILTKENNKIGEISLKSDSNYVINSYYGEKKINLKDDQILYPIITSQLNKKLVENKNFKGWNFPTRYDCLKNVFLEIEINEKNVQLQVSITLY